MPLQQHGAAGATEAEGTAAEVEAAAAAFEADAQFGAISRQRTGDGQISVDGAQAFEAEAGAADAQLLHPFACAEGKGLGGGALPEAEVQRLAGGVDAQLGAGAEADAIEPLQRRLPAGHQGIAGGAGGAALDQQGQAALAQPCPRRTGSHRGLHLAGGDANGTTGGAAEADRALHGAEAGDAQADGAAIELKFAIGREGSGEGALQVETLNTAHHRRAAELARQGAVRTHQQFTTDMADAKEGAAAVQSKAGLLGSHHPGVLAVAGFEGQMKATAEYGITEWELTGGLQLDAGAGGGKGKAAGIRQADLAAGRGPGHHRQAGGRQAVAAGEAAVELEAAGFRGVEAVAGEGEGREAALAGEPAAGGGGAATGESLPVEHQGRLVQVEAEPGAGGPQAGGEMAAADHQLVHADGTAVGEQHLAVGFAFEEEITLQGDHVVDAGATTTAEAALSGQQVELHGTARREHLLLQRSVPGAAGQTQVAEAQAEALHPLQCHRSLRLQSPLAPGLTGTIDAALEAQRAAALAEGAGDAAQQHVAAGIVQADGQVCDAGPVLHPALLLDGQAAADAAQPCHLQLSLVDQQLLALHPIGEGELQRRAARTGADRLVDGLAQLVDAQAGAGLQAHLALKALQAGLGASLQGITGAAIGGGGEHHAEGAVGDRHRGLGAADPTGDP